jgi:thioredoxin reductase (NADPH)
VDDDDPAIVALRALPPELQGGQPVLSEAQLSVLRGYGIEREMAPGEVLFADGDNTYDLVVLLEGEVKIVQHYGRRDEVVLASYGANQFLGEMGLLTGQRAYLTAVATAAGRVLRIRPDQVRVIMAQELDLSELILRTFLVRHARLTYRGAGLTLVAPGLTSTPEGFSKPWLAIAFLRGGSTWKTRPRQRRFCGT